MLRITNSGTIQLIKNLCCPVAFFFPPSCPCSAAGCSVGRRMSRQHPFFFISSHTAVIILSAVDVTPRRGRHNKNSGRGALGPSLGLKPVILHLKWSCKHSQVVLKRDRLRHTNDMMKLCNKQVLTCSCLFWGPRRENGRQRRNRRFPKMIESVCRMKNGSTVARHNWSIHCRETLPQSASKYNKWGWRGSDGAKI